MRRRRSLKLLQRDIKKAKNDRAKAEAYFALALFHDNRSREAKAIPNYRNAICYGLLKEKKSRALAYLASSLWKTGQPEKAIGNARIAERFTHDSAFKTWIKRLVARIERNPYRR